MLGKRRAYGITFEGMGNSVQLALNQRVPGSSPGAPTSQSSPNPGNSPSSSDRPFVPEFALPVLAPFGLCAHMLSLAAISGALFRIQKFRSWRKKLSG